jgi:hypothetical protein
MAHSDNDATPIMPGADEVERKTGIKRQPGHVRGGAKGGEDSESADKPALPADDDAPLGDTDQHSS